MVNKALPDLIRQSIQFFGGPLHQSPGGRGYFVPVQASSATLAREGEISRLESISWATPSPGRISSSILRFFASATNSPDFAIAANAARKAAMRSLATPGGATRVRPISVVAANRVRIFF